MKWKVVSFPTPAGKLRYEIHTVEGDLIANQIRASRAIRIVNAHNEEVDG